MARRIYLIAFILVLLIAGLGGFFGGRLLLQRLGQDFGAEAQWTPQPAGTPRPAATLEAQNENTPTSRPVGGGPTRAPAAQPTATRTPLIVTVPTAAESAATPLVPEAGETSVSPFDTPLPLGDETPVPTDTIEPEATTPPAFPYALVRSVRYSSGDCPGTYLMGTVTDRAGNPVPGVRLSLIDEFGNKATAVTKPGPGDTGRYDFPMGGPARRFFVRVVNDAGQPLSQEVEVVHDLPPHENQPCRWADWRRQ